MRMAPTGPVNPANNIVVQPNITHQSLRSYQSLDDWSQIGEININVINRQSTSATMSQNEIVYSLNTLLLHQQYPSFSGEKGESVSDFISDLERCFSTVPSLTAAAKLNAVINNLQGDAKDTFRLLTPAEQSDYDRLVTAIKDRYTPTKTQLQTRKANLYKTCQRPGQKCARICTVDSKRISGTSDRWTGLSVYYYKWLETWIPKLCKTVKTNHDQRDPGPPSGRGPLYSWVGVPCFSNTRDPQGRNFRGHH